MSADTVRPPLLWPWWSSPDVLDGALCFTGTRVPVSAVLEFAEAGHTAEEIAAEYPTIPLRSIRAAMYQRPGQASPALPGTNPARAAAFLDRELAADKPVRWPEWQPIETVPRDGSRVLVATGTSEMQVTYATRARDLWPEWGYTHWMPAPPGPNND